MKYGEGAATAQHSDYRRGVPKDKQMETEITTQKRRTIDV